MHNTFCIISFHGGLIFALQEPLWDICCLMNQSFYSRLFSEWRNSWQARYSSIFFSSCSDLFTSTFENIFKIQIEVFLHGVLPEISKQVLSNRAKNNLINVSTFHDPYFFCHFWWFPANKLLFAFLFQARSVFKSHNISSSFLWYAFVIKVRGTFLCAIWTDFVWVRENGFF